RLPISGGAGTSGPGKVVVEGAAPVDDESRGGSLPRGPPDHLALQTGRRMDGLEKEVRREHPEWKDQTVSCKVTVRYGEKIGVAATADPKERRVVQNRAYTARKVFEAVGGLSKEQVWALEGVTTNTLRMLKPGEREELARHLKRDREE